MKKYKKKTENFNVNFYDFRSVIPLSVHAKIALGIPFTRPFFFDDFIQIVSVIAFSFIVLVFIPSKNAQVIHLDIPSEISLGTPLKIF